MVTWTTYGSWLPGDNRGYVKEGRILPADNKLLQANKARQKSPTVKLKAQEKKIVRKEILAEAKKIGHEIIVLAVCTNHIHLLARPHSQSIEDLAGKYKSLTTRALWKYGREGRIWTKGYDKRFCFSEDELIQRTRYVNKHNLG
ncbi:MAG: transposase [Phycisphaerae bacterium]|nr:transposase [Phycisphaerae bacterium]